MAVDNIGLARFRIGFIICFDASCESDAEEGAGQDARPTEGRFAWKCVLTRIL